MIAQPCLIHWWKSFLNYRTINDRVLNRVTGRRSRHGVNHGGRSRGVMRPEPSRLVRGAMHPWEPAAGARSLVFPIAPPASLAPRLRTGHGGAQ